MRPKNYRHFVGNGPSLILAETTEIIRINRFSRWVRGKCVEHLQQPAMEHEYWPRIVVVRGSPNGIEQHHRLMPTPHLSAGTFSSGSRWLFATVRSVHSLPSDDRIHDALWNSISQREHLDSRTHSYRFRKIKIQIKRHLHFDVNEIWYLPCYFRSNFTAAIRFDRTRAQRQCSDNGTACWFHWTRGFRINAVFFGFGLGLISIRGTRDLLLLILDGRIVSRWNHLLNWFVGANGWLQSISTASVGIQTVVHGFYWAITYAIRCVRTIECGRWMFGIRVKWRYRWNLTATAAI